MFIGLMIKNVNISKTQQIKLITEIERRGLTEKGLYRIPGAESMVKELKEKLLQNRDSHPFVSFCSAMLASFLSLCDN